MTCAGFGSKKNCIYHKNTITGIVKMHTKVNMITYLLLITKVFLQVALLLLAFWCLRLLILSFHSHRFPLCSGLLNIGEVLYSRFLEQHKNSSITDGRGQSNKGW